jgi:hypothetical protein
VIATPPCRGKVVVLMGLKAVDFIDCLDGGRENDF